MDRCTFSCGNSVRCFRNRGKHISLFMTQFSTEFADTATMAQLALYFTIMTGTMAICQPIARKLFAKIDTRVVISLAVILAAGGFFAISFYTNYIGWMFSGVVIGFGFSFIVYLLGPILINNSLFRALHCHLIFGAAHHHKQGLFTAWIHCYPAAGHPHSDHYAYQICKTKARCRFKGK